MPIVKQLAFGFPFASKAKGKQQIKNNFNVGSVIKRS